VYYVDRLFAAGQMWEIADDDADAAQVFCRLEQAQPLSSDMLRQMSDKLQSILQDLLDEGIVVYQDDKKELHQ
jgi:hypothetical protein